MARNPRIHMALPFVGTPPAFLHRSETEHEPNAQIDADALDAIAYLLTAEEWPGPSAIEDIAHIVHSTGRAFDDQADWISH